MYLRCRSGGTCFCTAVHSARACSDVYAYCTIKKRLWIKSRATGYIMWLVTLLMSSLISFKGESCVPCCCCFLWHSSGIPSCRLAWAERGARECLLVARGFPNSKFYHLVSVCQRALVVAGMGVEPIMQTVSVR